MNLIIFATNKVFQRLKEKRLIAYDIISAYLILK